jgi:GNAT superfamily N-acetyltransferase
MARVTGEPEPSRPGVPAITRLGEDDWRVWREVRLAALADAPSAFASALEKEEALREDDWRAMIREAAIFVATTGGVPVGVAAGLPRRPARERGLGAMWVTPEWRGSGVAAMLASAVAGWARAQGCVRVGLWVPTDNARARRFYQRQGFRTTGHSRPFPTDTGRSISEMILDLG